MARVPSLKDLAFLAIPSRVPSLKQLARAAVAANRAPLPAHTLARRQNEHMRDVVPRLVRKLWETIWQTIAKTTNFGNDVLILLTPNLDSWRRMANWKLDIPRPPEIDLQVPWTHLPLSARLPPTRDQWLYDTQPHAWNWNTRASQSERLLGGNWKRQSLERFNIPLGAGGTQNWWNTMFPPVPTNQRRIHAEDFDVKSIFYHKGMPFGNVVGV
jgi:hypothetical protein